MRHGNREPVAIAILAKAPIPGFAKTRLIPALGAEGAADLQARLIARAVETAAAAATGPVTLWASPNESHSVIRLAKARHGVALARQPAGDLGLRMLAAIEAARGPALVIGTDCPALTPALLRDCAATLADGVDAALVPAEDGGYVLIGMRRPDQRVFADIPWGGSLVTSRTRSRLARLAFSWREPARLWDVDRPSDLAKLAAAKLL
jgi:hypothetical protein